MKTIKNPIFQIVVICLLFRVVLFTLYDFKVSECPDSWSFTHFAAQMSKKANQVYTSLFVDVSSNSKVPSSKISILTSINSKGFVAERSPGYPLIIFLCGSKFTTVLFQFLLGIITAVYWFKTLLKLKFSINQSKWITLLLQTYLSLFIYETFILVETTVLFLISIVFYHLANDYLSPKKTIKFELFLSVILGFLVLVKPFYILIPCLIIGLKFLEKPNIKSIISRKLIVLIFPFMVYFGWSFVVQKFTGYFVSTTYFGLNKAQNCVYFAEKGPKEFDWIMKPYVKHRELAIKEHKDVAMSIWYAINSGEFKDRNLTFPQLSNELGKYASATIKNNFSEYLYQVVTKSWFDFWKVFDSRLETKFDNKKVELIVSKLYLFQHFIFTLIKFSFLVLSLFYFYNYMRFRVLNFEFMVCAVVWIVSILQALVTYGENARFSFPFEYLMVIVVILFLKNWKNATFKWNTFLSISQQS